MSMDYIDMEQWPRRDHFRFFSGLSFPFYSVTVPLDVTALRETVKARGLSFHHAMCYCVTRAMSGIADFRYKIRGEGVVLVPRLHPGLLTMDQSTHLFKLVNMEWPEDRGLEAFCREAAAAEAAQEGYFPTSESEARDDFIYFSSTPWFSFTAMTHEMDCNPDDSVPRVTWGRFEAQNGRYTLPFNVQFNHRLLDGYHLHLLLEALTALFPSV